MPLGFALVAVWIASAAVSAPSPEPSTVRRGYDESWDDQVLYFVMVDRFADSDQPAVSVTGTDDRGAFHGGDLRGLLGKLDYLQDLGVTALWLTPLATQVDTVVTGAGFPDAAYHGYWPEDLSGVDPRFGTATDLADLTDAAHARGMRVVLDVVVNHVGYGSVLARDRTMVRSSETGSCPDEDARDEVNQCLFGLPDLRTEREEVRAWIVAQTLAWLKLAPVDGFRLDALKHVDPELLVELRLALKGGEARPWTTLPKRTQPWLLGEVWGEGPDTAADSPWITEHHIDALVDFSFDGLVEGFLTGRMSARALAHHLERRHTAEGPALAHFIDSHDVTTLVSRLSPSVRHRYPMAAFVQMSVRGIPIVTYGDELGREGGPWPLNRQFMPWHDVQSSPASRTRSVWQSLISSRRHFAALRGRSWKTVHTSDEEDGGATLVYQRGNLHPLLAPNDATAPKPDEQAVWLALRRGPGSASVPIEVNARPCPAVQFGDPVVVERRAESAWTLHLPADSAVLMVLSPSEAARCVGLPALVQSERLGLP